MAIRKGDTEQRRREEERAKSEKSLDLEGAAMPDADDDDLAETPIEPVRRGGRNPSYDRDWTQGSIIGNLWSLAWPTTINTAVRMAGPTIDMIWVGALGTAALAGVGVSGIAVQMINSAKMGLNTGTRAMVARFIGAKDEEGANHVAQQAIVISLGFSVITAIIGLTLAEPILVLLGVEPDVVVEGAAYMKIMFVGSIAMSFSMMCQSLMQASGDAITPMKITMWTRGFHIALCPILIFGWGVIPGLGVKGAALTNVTSQGVGGAFMLWVLLTGRTRLHLSLKNFSLDWVVIWRIIKIGVPASINGMERSLANFILMIFIVPFGTTAVAAHALAQRIDNFVHMPAQGLGQASGVLAGQNLGAGLPERSAQTGWIAAALFTVVMAFCSVGIWFYAEYIVMVFNREPELVHVTAKFLRIDIVSYMVFGIVMVLMNCLNGMGDTMVPMIVTLISMWFIQVPLAWLLPQITDLGVYGVRWAIVTAIVIRAVIYAVYFKKGRWRRITV